MSRQSTLNKFFTPKPKQSRSAKTPLTAEQKERMQRNKQLALQKKKEFLQKSQKMNGKKRSRSQMESEYVSNENHNNLNHINNNNNHNHNNRLSERPAKRPRLAIKKNYENQPENEEDLMDIDIDIEINKKKKNKKNDSDSDYEPVNEAEISASESFSEALSETSSHPSPIKFKKKKPSKFIADEDEDEDDDNDIDMALDYNDNKNDNNNDNKNNNDGDETLQLMQTFQNAQNQMVHHNNNNNNNNNNNHIERDGAFQEFLREYEKKKNDPNFKKQNGGKKTGGAIHRAIAHYDWYKNPKDFSGRSPDHPDYKKNQIKVPGKFLDPKSKLMTNSQIAYWKIKRNHFDGILFFKVGKFYELYYEDAKIGNKLFGLSLIEVPETAPHCGFPEQSFTKYCESFVNYGYKVHRVEQMVDSKKVSKGLVPREICEVLTRGTLVENELINYEKHNYLIAVVEDNYVPNIKSNKNNNNIDNDMKDMEEDDKDNIINNNNNNNDDYLYYKFNKDGSVNLIMMGVCFIDLSTGEMNIGTFEDDRNRTRLRTLLVQIDPSEVVYKKRQTSNATLALLKNEFKTVVKSSLYDEEQFFSAERCKAILLENNYWDDGNNNNNNNKATPNMPEILQKNWNNKLAMHALGGILYYLQHTMHDREVLPHSVWKSYDATNNNCTDFLSLDGSTLQNLEILTNEEGGLNGTLLNFVDKTVTGFGKRRMKEWLRSPLKNIDSIEMRLNSVEYFLDEDSLGNKLRDELRDEMSKLPDLERLLHNLAVLGTKNRKIDSCYLFEPVWQEKKIKKLIQVIRGFEQIHVILDNIETNYRSDLKKSNANLLNSITSIVERHSTPKKKKILSKTDNIPKFNDILKEFKESFDWELASKHSRIEPMMGKNESFDKCCQELNQNEDDLEHEFRKIKKKYPKIHFKWYHPKKNKMSEKYQIEVPVKELHRFNEPDDWEQTTKTKSVQRYHTFKIKELLEDREELMDEKESILKDAARATFARFAKYGLIWKKIVNNIAMLDCLISLSWIISYSGYEMCRPEFIQIGKNESPVLELRNCVHPCIDSESLGTQFIPNDTFMNVPNENLSNFIIVTGPNMGGKSTLLRQTCIAVILAHMGCYVTATKCRLSLVDRIFTRVGANDRILAGQSTFMVELEETSNILRHATKNSLVILDELGRGTSTFDGTAIAFAVAKNIINDIQCRCLFSTHYHSICDYFEHDQNVAMYHMSYQEINHNVTFLYKFIEGVCKQSHGIHCARMAGLNEAILKKAKYMSEELKQRMNGQRMKQDTLHINQLHQILGGLLLNDTKKLRCLRL